MALLSGYLQRQRLKNVLRWTTGSVLDLGCADAAILLHIEHQIESYCGVELSPDLVDELRRRHPRQVFLCLDMDQSQLDVEERFDTVLMTAFIENIYNQKHLFTEVVRHLKPYGRIVITTPTPLGDSVHRWGAKLGLFAKSAQHHHPVIFTKHRFRVFADNFGLCIERYRRFQFGCNQLVILRRHH